MHHAYRTALVTGASSGIGNSFARLLAQEGSDLVVVARRADRLEKLAAQLSEEHQVTVEVLAADLAAAKGLAAVSQRLSDKERPIELLVNNAGIGASGAFAKEAADTIAAQLKLNVLALTRLTRAALPGMIERRHGGILNVSSMAGFVPSPGTAVYAATKAFVTSLSESLHAEARPAGVHVTALCPGLTRTEFHEASHVESGYLPKFFWLEADDVARAGLAAVSAGRVLAVPGAQYKAAASAVRFLPRLAIRRATQLARRP
jgi:hypothetical protein